MDQKPLLPGPGLFLFICFPTDSASKSLVRLCLSRGHHWLKGTFKSEGELLLDELSSSMYYPAWNVQRSRRVENNFIAQTVNYYGGQCGCQDILCFMWLLEVDSEIRI